MVRSSLFPLPPSARFPDSAANQRRHRCPSPAVITSFAFAGFLSLPLARLLTHHSLHHIEHGTHAHSGVRSCAAILSGRVARLLRKSFSMISVSAAIVAAAGIGLIQGTRDLGHDLFHGPQEDCNHLSRSVCSSMSSWTSAESSSCSPARFWEPSLCLSAAAVLLGSSVTGFGYSILEEINFLRGLGFRRRHSRPLAPRWRVRQSRAIANGRHQY